MEENTVIKQSLFVEKYNTERILFEQTLIGGVLPITSTTSYYLKYQPIIDYFPKEITEQIISNYPSEDLMCTDNYNPEEDDRQEKENMECISMGKNNLYTEYDSDFELCNSGEEDTEEDGDIWERDYSCDKYK